MNQSIITRRHLANNSRDKFGAMVTTWSTEREDADGTRNCPVSSVHTSVSWTNPDPHYFSEMGAS